MPKSLRDGLLPALDIVRGIPGQLGLRLFTVTVYIRRWSGERPGVGTVTEQSFELRVSKGGQPVKVRTLTTREVVASGGLYRDLDIEVGPLTPPYPGSDADESAIDIFDPDLDTNTAVEMYFKVTGPRTTDLGWYKKIEQRTDRPLRYMLVLRKTGEVP